MLVSVSLVFGLSWLPLNLLNVISDFSPLFSHDDQLFRIVFAVCHLIGCSSACSNPILYGFLNENFRKEMHQVYTQHWRALWRRLLCLYAHLCRHCCCRPCCCGSGRLAASANAAYGVGGSLVKATSEANGFTDAPEEDEEDCEDEEELEEARDSDSSFTWSNYGASSAGFSGSASSTDTASSGSSSSSGWGGSNLEDLSNETAASLTGDSDNEPPPSETEGKRRRRLVAVGVANAVDGQRLVRSALHVPGLLAANGGAVHSLGRTLACSTGAIAASCQPAARDKMIIVSNQSRSRDQRQKDTCGGATAASDTGAAGGALVERARRLSLAVVSRVTGCGGTGGGQQPQRHSLAACTQSMSTNRREKTRRKSPSNGWARTPAEALDGSALEEARRQQQQQQETTRSSFQTITSGGRRTLGRTMHLCACSCISDGSLETVAGLSEMERRRQGCSRKDNKCGRERRARRHISGGAGGGKRDKLTKRRRHRRGRRPGGGEREAEASARAALDCECQCHGKPEVGEEVVGSEEGATEEQRRQKSRCRSGSLLSRREFLPSTSHFRRASQQHQQQETTLDGGLASVLTTTPTSQPGIAKAPTWASRATWKRASRGKRVWLRLFAASASLSSSPLSAAATAAAGGEEAVELNCKAAAGERPRRQQQPCGDGVGRLSGGEGHRSRRLAHSYCAAGETEEGARPRQVADQCDKCKHSIRSPIERKLLGRGRGRRPRCEESGEAEEARRGSKRRGHRRHLRRRDKGRTRRLLTRHDGAAGAADNLGSGGGTLEPAPADEKARPPATASLEAGPSSPHCKWPARGQQQQVGTVYLKVEGLAGGGRSRGNSADTLASWSRSGERSTSVVVLAGDEDEEDEDEECKTAENRLLGGGRQCEETGELREAPKNKSNNRSEPVTAAACAHQQAASLDLSAALEQQTPAREQMQTSQLEQRRASRRELASQQSAPESGPAAALPPPNANCCSASSVCGTAEPLSSASYASTSSFFVCTSASLSSYEGGADATGAGLSEVCSSSSAASHHSKSPGRGGRLASERAGTPPSGSCTSCSLSGGASWLSFVSSHCSGSATTLSLSQPAAPLTAAHSSSALSAGGGDGQLLFAVSSSGGTCSSSSSQFALNNCTSNSASAATTIGTSARRLHHQRQKQAAEKGDENRSKLIMKDGGGRNYRPPDEHEDAQEAPPSPSRQLATANEAAAERKKDSGVQLNQRTYSLTCVGAGSLARSRAAEAKPVAEGRVFQLSSTRGGAAAAPCGAHVEAGSGVRDQREQIMRRSMGGTGEAVQVGATGQRAHAPDWLGRPEGQEEKSGLISRAAEGTAQAGGGLEGSSKGCVELIEARVVAVARAAATTTNSAVTTAATTPTTGRHCNGFA